MKRFIKTKHMKLYEQTKIIIGNYFDRLEDEFPMLSSIHIVLEHSNHLFRAIINIRSKSCISGEIINVNIETEGKNIYSALASAFESIKLKISRQTRLS